MPEARPYAEAKSFVCMVGITAATRTKQHIGMCAVAGMLSL